MRVAPFRPASKSRSQKAPVNVRSMSFEMHLVVECAVAGGIRTLPRLVLRYILQMYSVGMPLGRERGFELACTFGLRRPLRVTHAEQAALASDDYRHSWRLGRSRGSSSNPMCVLSV